MKFPAVASAEAAAIVVTLALHAFGLMRRRVLVSTSKLMRARNTDTDTAVAVLWTAVALLIVAADNSSTCREIRTENVSTIGLGTSCGVNETEQPVAEMVVAGVMVELSSVACVATQVYPGAEVATVDTPGAPYGYDRTCNGLTVAERVPPARQKHLDRLP